MAELKTKLVHHLENMITHLRLKLGLTQLFFMCHNFGSVSKYELVSHKVLEFHSDLTYVEKPAKILEKN